MNFMHARDIMKTILETLKHQCLLFVFFCRSINLLSVSQDPDEALLEKCPKTEFFLVRVFPIWAEYGDLRSKSLYSVRIRENRTIKNFRIWTIFTQWKDI